jgi:hypothetical protein
MTHEVLQIANQEGIPIYTINATNINEILPRLQVSEAVKAGIRGAVASGMVVTIPEKNIQYYNWSGVGYIVLNPETGAGAYMISGGLAGGHNANGSEDEWEELLNHIAAECLMHGPKCGIYLGFGIFGLLLSLPLVGGVGAYLIFFALATVELSLFATIAIFGFGLVLFLSAVIAVYLLAVTILELRR